MGQKMYLIAFKIPRTKIHSHFQNPYRIILLNFDLPQHSYIYGRFA